jgi:hypothetical protein
MMMGSRFAVPVLVLGLFALALGGSLQAQTGQAQTSQSQIIQGQVLDGETRQGVEGTLVLLLDPTGQEVTGVLTNRDGLFRMRAPAPGSYSLRAERIGYETVGSEVLHVGNELIPGITLVAEPFAVELEELRVEGEQQCVIRPADGLELARVWEEARKALTVQEWTEGEGLYRFQLVRYERGLHPDSRTTLSEERDRTVVVNSNPIRGLPVSELLEEGFIRPTDDGGHNYYGPDASVLLSDLFLDTHCFRLRDSGESPDLVGLSFEPAARRRVPDIEGTLWLDRATAELVRLDYSYDWAPWPEVGNVAEGRVEFQKMPSGAFIIRKWWIRMPSVGRVRGVSNGGYPVLRLVEIREVGSEVEEVTLMDHQRVDRTDRRPRGALRGMAWDSLRTRPLSGASVYLSGTQYDALTDEDGHFFMEGVPEGDYSAAVVHPSIDSLGFFPRGVVVRVSGGDTADVRLGLPSKSTFMESVCAEGSWQVDDALVTGTVRQGEGGEAAAGALVSLEWSRYRINDTGTVVGRTRMEMQVVTDAHGRYRGCGIPAGTTVTATASIGDSRENGPTLEMRIGEAAVLMLDLTVPVAARR